MMTTSCGAVVLAGVVTYAAALSPVPATADNFFARKTITIVVGSSAGGSIDMNGRLLACYLGSHVPGNPDLIVQNMPGAASLNAVRYLDANAPKDGTVIVDFNFGPITESKINPDRKHRDAVEVLAHIGRRPAGRCAPCRGHRAHPRAAKVIKLLTMATTLARSFILSAQVPVDRLQVLRRAFGATMTDPAFLADAARQQQPVQPTIGEDCLTIVQPIYALRDSVVAAAKHVATE